MGGLTRLLPASPDALERLLARRGKLLARLRQRTYTDDETEPITTAIARAAQQAVADDIDRITAAWIVAWINETDTD